VSSARRTAFSSDLSSNSFKRAMPAFLPKATRTTRRMSSFRPAVEMLLRAKRTLPSRLPLIDTLHSSAFENEHAVADAFCFFLVQLFHVFPR
jgi:hypothetical protein